MRILVYGDLIWDTYRYCSASRLCPEAPVPVLVVDHEETRQGGAGLVAKNLESLGLKVQALYGSQSTKTRYYVDTHMVIRVDDDSHDVRSSEEWRINLQDDIGLANIIVVSDYCKGAITEPIARMLVDSGKLCFVDTKNGNVEWFQGQNVTLFPNQGEYPNVQGKEHLFGAVIEKRGHEGCRVWNDNYHPLSVPVRERTVKDICGAGDVFLAAFVWATAQGMNAQECAQVANEAAGRSVEHLGTYTLKPEDVMQKATIF